MQEQGVGIKDIGFIIGRIIVGPFYIWNGINHFTSLSALSEYAKAKGVLCRNSQFFSQVCFYLEQD